MKKYISVLLCVIMMFSLLACSSTETPEQDETVAQTEKPADAQTQTGIYTPGTYEGKTMGFGGEVVVKITVDENNITACEIVGDSETAGIGSNAVEQLPEKIVAANGGEVDAVSGATTTSTAINQALASAIKAAKGEATTTAMTPGTYQGEGFGYSLISPIVVSVEVSEDAIKNIEIVSAERETGPIFQTAADALIPRMIESQSLAVDSITGATLASTGIRAAVTDALTQAMGGDASGLDAFQTVPEKNTAQETIDVDVLVIGMGGSGCAAAMSAAEAAYEKDPNNVSVLAIDKSAKFGGTSANCAEPMAVNAPRYKEAYNNGEDYMDKELMRKNWLEYVDGGAKVEILDLFLDNSGETIDWLYFDHGFVFNNPTTGFAETDIYRCKYQYTYLMNAEEGRDYGIELKFRNEQVDEYFQKLMADFTALGGEYKLETEAYELLYDPQTNAITGAKARYYDGTEYTINAKAVILATGGFAGNGEMEEKYFTNEYYPIKGEWGTYRWGMSHNDGKMVQSAIDIGAGTYNIDMPPMVHFATTTGYLQEFPVTEVDPSTTFSMIYNWYGQNPTWTLNDIPLAMALSGNVLQVDVNGRRYANENELFVWWEAGPKFFSIWSEAQVKEVNENGYPLDADGNSLAASAIAQGQGGVPAAEFKGHMYEVIDKAIEKGYLYKADTLEELAAMTGMDAATLKASVETYNASCEAGEDKEYGKDPSLLWALGNEGPYYAVSAASVVYSTCGALDVDTEIRVLQADGTTPIGGLYAVGNDSGGVLYTNTKPYVTYGGAALGWAFTSGRLAGRNSVDYISGIN